MYIHFFTITPVFTYHYITICWEKYFEYRIDLAGNFRIVEHHTKIENFLAQCVLRHYAELYEYLNYEIKMGIYSSYKNCHQRKLPGIR